jgi:hypothetical protein
MFDGTAICTCRSDEFKPKILFVENFTSNDEAIVTALLIAGTIVRVHIVSIFVMAQSNSFQSVEW